MFLHSSTPRKISDNVTRFRYTEIPNENGPGALTEGNQIKFRFSSNQDSWHSPSLSYILYEIEAKNGANSLTTADGVAFNDNMGASIRILVIYKVQRQRKEIL